MHSLLTKLLIKKGITNIKELSKEEQDTFSNYEYVLNKREMTLEDLKVFLIQQIGLIEAKWQDYEYQKKEYLIPYHTCYKTLLRAIESPQLERSNLEKYLVQLISN